MTAAKIAAARLLLEEQGDDGDHFGLRLLARIERAWRARQRELELAIRARREQMPQH